jgi:phosphoribosylformylglycinamidine synthase
MVTMAKVRVIVVRAAGINCDEETVYAWELAGAAATRVHVDRLLESPALLDDVQVLTVPGGFSYGDDIAAGKILGSQMEAGLRDVLHGFVEAGKLVLGICNGFQVLLRARLLPEWGDEWQCVTLAWNDSSRFEARWVHLEVCTDRCAFLPAGARFALPIAHAEGKIVTDSDETLATLEKSGNVALRYVDERGQPGAYPVNPNGSVGHVAGLTDGTGQVLGLMPHPERFVDRTQHPEWTRRKADGEADGLTIFRTAVARFR